MGREYRAYLGSHFPAIPVGHFVRQKVDMKVVWELVGPTIERNFRKSDMQKLFCIAFIEGMRMALAAQDDPASR